jgi:hypothetical protein
MVGDAFGRPVAIGSVIAGIIPPIRCERKHFVTDGSARATAAMSA